MSYGLPRVNIAKGQFITRSIREKSGSKQIIKGNSCKIIKKKSIRENKSLQKKKTRMVFSKGYFSCIEVIDAMVEESLELQIASSESFSEAISELGNERDSGNEEELIDSRGVF